MDSLTWVAVGLVAGIIAKIVHPGKDPGGLIITIALGVGGAYVGGFIGRELGFGGVDGFDPKSIGIAAGGAFLLLIVWRLPFGRKKSD